MKAQSNSDKYVGIRGAMLFTGKSSATLRRAVRLGVLPAFRVGLGLPRYHRLAFRLCDLERWMRSDPVIPDVKVVVDEIVAKVSDAH